MTRCAGKVKVHEVKHPGRLVQKEVCLVELVEPGLYRMKRLQIHEVVQCWATNLPEGWLLLVSLHLPKNFENDFGRGVG